MFDKMSCGVRSFPVLLGLLLLYVSLTLGQAYDDNQTTQEEEDQERYQHALRLLEQLVETRKGLSALKGVIKGIDTDLMETQKRWSSCAIGLGMAGYQCHLSTLHDDSNTKDWVATNPLSPGKRASSPQEVVRKVKDLSRKRKGLEIMKKLVDQMDSDIITEQKRTCALNLGGHCATESAASLADQWHYLNSPLSPGRKRRDTRLYQRLVRGKIFQ